MKQQYAQEWPQFFTATIQEWKHLLKEDKYKNIIIDSLRFLSFQILGRLVKDQASASHGAALGAHKIGS
jgi:hypothetical protein